MQILRGRNRVRWLRLRHRIQPILCKLGRHDVADCRNYDGSVDHGMCLTCLADTPPRSPCSPDMETAHEMLLMREAALEAMREADDDD